MKIIKNGKWSVVVVLLIVFLAWTSTAFSLGLFEEGVVTAKVWEDRQPRIEISNIEYMLMPSVTVSNIVKNESGDAVSAEPVTPLYIKKGMRVLFKALGHNIYEIEIVQ